MPKGIPFTAVLLGGGALALGGMPPFNIFLSEFMTVTAGLAAEHLAVTILLLILLTLVLGGLVRMVAKVLFATPPQQVATGELGWLTTAPMAILLVMMLVMGTHIPQPVSRLLVNAASIVQPDNDQHPTQLGWLWANFDTTATSATPPHRQGE